MPFKKIMTHKNLKSSILLVTVLSLLTISTLISCSSGNKSDRNTTSTDGHYIPYRGSLSLVNSGDFSKQTISSNNILRAIKLQSYDYDSATGTTLNVHDEFVVYIDNNKLWKLDITQDSEFMPQQFSSADMSMYCGTEYIYKFFKYQLSITNPEDTIFLYETAGDDGDCSYAVDNRIFMVRADDPPDTAPVDVTDKTGVNLLNTFTLFDSNNIENGASDILVINRDNNTLYRYDRNFEKPTALITATRWITIVDNNQINTDGRFVKVDDELYWYDVQLKSMSNSLFSHTGLWTGNMNCDKSYCYFDVRETTGYFSIYRIQPDGSSPAEPVALNISNGYQFYISGLTENFIIFKTSYDQPQSSDLYKLPKSGGSPILIDSSINRIAIAYATKSNIYYYKHVETLVNGSSVTTSIAKVIDENNTAIREYPNANWLGGQLASESEQANFSKLVLLKDLAEVENTSGAILQVYDVNQNQPTITLGSFPAGSMEIIIMYGYDNTALAYVNFKDSIDPPHVYYDVFAMDFNRANSLTRLTNTPDISERPIN